MKPKQLALVVLILAIAALCVTFAPIVAPNSAFGKKVAPKLGLDIRGGLRVVFEADLKTLPAGQTWNEDTRAAVLRTLDNRVNANGVAEPLITPKGEAQFVVEIPAVKNTDDLVSQLEKTAQLEFYYSPDWKTRKNALGRYALVGSEDNKRESYEVVDNKTNKTFRDPFHIARAFSELVEAGKRTKAPEIPTPPALRAMAHTDTIAIQDSDKKALEGLVEELESFKSFLAAARKELDGSDLQPGQARATFGSGSQWSVELAFNSKGREKFSQFTKDHTDEILLIYLDGQILMAPHIEGPITDGKAIISPFPTIEDAKGLADYLNGGAMPVTLQKLQDTRIEATLGAEAVRNGLIAGAIGILAVIFFMIWVYRLPGVVACGALILYTFFTYSVFVLIPVTFTLPGIAGFILSVGMAVDANILIFERTKEELKSGKSLKNAITTGFQRAFSAIFDSNMCTAVTSLLLYELGNGSVRGFALTLIIGVALSMFTAITVTRSFLLLMVGDGKNVNLDAWGVNRLWRPQYHVIRKRPTFYGISLLIIVPGVIFALLGGFKTGIEFTGGSELTLSFPKAVTRTDVEGAFEKLGVKESQAQIAGDNKVFVRLPKQEGKGEISALEANAMVEKLQSTFPGVRKESFESIGGTISKELTRNALTSIGLSSLFIVLYLTFRFAIGGFKNGLKFGVAAVIAMLHDVGVLVGLFCALGYFLNWKVDSLFVTAALTVVGFSVHDTIIIFDRIRENLKLQGEKANFGDLIDTSINETFARSIFTSGTVVITLFALLLFGGSVIRPLNAALLIGIISGTYSSIFNAAPLVFDWQKRFGKGGEGLAQVGDAAPAAPAPAPVVAVAEPTEAQSAGDDQPEARPGTWAQGPRPKRRRM